MKKLVFTLLLLSSAFTMYGQPDSIRLSLLTCGPGQEIYALFGHTAIRYENYSRGIDAVFNYGLFSFRTPHFVLRFTLGETDYQLGVTNYERFAAEYMHDNRIVWQQTLHLTPAQQEKLVNLLEENYLPENRIYRYNFFYDNCATRPRDQIERAIGSALHYQKDMNTHDTGVSYRDLVKKHTNKHPWAQFGMNLCLGSKADRPISRRQMMFAPFCLKRFFDNAIVTNEHGTSYPLVEKSFPLIQSAPQDVPPSSKFTPLQASCLLFLIIVAATCWEIHRKQIWWGIDLALFSMAGIAGCILSFLTLFSQHPAVSPNYLLILFHPFHLIALPWIIHCLRKHQECPYLMINLAILTFFILLWKIIPQEFDIAILPLALSLLVRSANNALKNRLLHPRTL